MKEQDKITKVAKLLKKSNDILFITGAGISADSGLPTYRGVGGLYDGKATDDGIPVEMALAGDMLEKRPEVTWKYLAQIEARCRDARFNRAHEVIAEMDKYFRRIWVLTQNIDGFHHVAGSKNIIDIHGDMHKLLCSKCGWRAAVKDYSNVQIPPHCPECNGPLRPDVVFFGELLPKEKLDTLMHELKKGFDIYFSVGTTSVFPYISEPVILAKSLGRPTVEINPTETEISHMVDIKISLGAAEAMERIWKTYNS